MNNQPEDVNAYNQSSLKDLAWAIEASQGEFSLLLAHCNYVQLRDRLAQQLQSISQVKITELRLDPSDLTLYSKIRDLLKQEKPEALMVMELESVKNIAELLRATNQVREEFRKHFHFPLLLWINDEIQRQLTQLAFDFQDWGTTVRFAIPVNVLIKELGKRLDRLFTITLQSGFDSFLSNEIIFGNNYRLELDAALEDLTSLGQELPPELEAGRDFIDGRAEYTNGNFIEALEHYNNSLAFWQQERNNFQEKNYPLREADLQFHIGLCYFRQAETENQTTEKWQKAKQSLQQCLAIFERVERPDLAAKFIHSLAEVLAILEDWQELDNLAQKAINLHKKDDYRVYLAQDYALLALVALKQSRYEDAKKNASLAFWQEQRNDSQEENAPLREADLQFHIGLCYFRQAERENQTTEKWQKAKQSLQQCLAIFERVERPDLTAKFINFLAEVLAILKDWEELDKLAQIAKKTINLHKKYDDRVYLAQDYSFLALVALNE